MAISVSLLIPLILVCCLLAGGMLAFGKIVTTPEPQPSAYYMYSHNFETAPERSVASSMVTSPERAYVPNGDVERGLGPGRRGSVREIVMGVDAGRRGSGREGSYVYGHDRSMSGQREMAYGGEGGYPERAYGGERGYGGDRGYEYEHKGGYPDVGGYPEPPNANRRSGAERDVGGQRGPEMAYVENTEPKPVVETPVP